MALHYEMNTDDHAFGNHVSEQMSYLPINLHKEMIELVAACDNTTLIEFCSELLLKITEVQQYVGKLFVKGLASTPPEEIASYSFFVQQLLAIYSAANVHLARLQAK